VANLKPTISYMARNSHTIPNKMNPIKFVDPKEFWTAQENLITKSPLHWAKLSVGYDKRLGQKYYSVLLGKKGKNKSHSHLGYTLTGSLFFNENQNLMPYLEKDVESQLYGKSPKEKVVYKNIKPKCKVIFQVTTKASSSESKVSKFEINDE